MQKRNPEHPAFLADGADTDIDPADPVQLLLPGFLSSFFFYYRFPVAYNLTACRNVVFAVSVCQQAEVTYPYIARG